MKRYITLQEYIKSADSIDKDEITITIDPRTITPGVDDVFRKLNRLGLLHDKVIMSLIAQAPMDPLGLVSFCNTLGGWEFYPENFSVRKVLARNASEKKEPTAFMIIDVLGNDMIFIARKGNEFVTTKTITRDTLLLMLENSSQREQDLQKIIEDSITETVDAVDLTTHHTDHLSK